MFVVATAAMGGLLFAGGIVLLGELHPGKEAYDVHCGECHESEGVISILRQSGEAVETLKDAAHIAHHVADPSERALVLDYLRQELGDD